MPRKRSQNRDKAFEIYKSKNGNITSKELAEKLNENVANIRTWKNADKWDIQLGFKKNKKGAPKCNSNAIGNKGGAPKGNLNNLKHGSYIDNNRFSSNEFLKKYLPAASAKIIEEIEESGMNTLDMLWASIILQQTNIIRTQRIMNVKDNKDINKELKKVSEGKNKSKEWLIQFADDRQAKFAKTLSDSIRTLNKLIRDYEEMLNKNWDTATEEQKLRLEKLKVEVAKMSDKKEENKGNLNKLIEVFNKGSAK